METIQAFRIALAPARDGLSDSQLEHRRGQARTLAAANMPSLYRSREYLVKERLLSDDGHFWLAFNLEVSPQLSLELREPGKRLSKRATDFTRLTSELSSLKTEALGFAIRIGEMAQTASVLSRLGDQAGEIVEQVLNEDSATWKIAHDQSGREVSIDFDGQVIATQLPLIPQHILERATRQITCYVESIDRDGMWLTRVRENGAKGEAALPSISLPQRIKLHRPPDTAQHVAEGYFLLYVAHRDKLKVRIDTRLALRQQDMSPSHLQLAEVADRSRLIHSLMEHAASLCSHSEAELLAGP